MRRLGHALRWLGVMTIAGTGLVACNGSDSQTVIEGILGHLQKIGGNHPHEGTAQRGPPVG